MKKLFPIVCLFILLSSCNNSNKIKEYRNQIEREFDSINVKTLDGKKIALTKYIDSIGTIKPLVIHAFSLWDESSFDNIKQLYEYKKMGQDFELLVISTKRLTKKEGKLKLFEVRTDEELIKKLKSFKLPVPIVYNSDGSFRNQIAKFRLRTRTLLHENQTYIIKGDSIPYFNDHWKLDNYLEATLVWDAIKSQEKPVVKNYKAKKINVSISYGFDNLKRIGLWEKKYGEKTRSLGKYVDGKKDGKWIWYNSDGKPDKIVNYVSGKLNGEYKYYSSGYLFEIGNYKNDKKNGPWKGYHKDGKTRYSVNYINGKKDGIYKYYHENGQLETQKNYQRGKIIGQSKTYYDDGSLATDITCKEGKMNGIAKEYYKSGSLKNTGVYKDDLQIGKWTWYYENKEIKEIAHYLDGTLTGEWKLFHTNGNIKQITILKEGKVNGPLKLYYKDGTLKQEGTIKNDLQHGEWKDYHNNGKLYTSRLWESGKLMDVLSAFNNQGKAVDKGSISNGNGTINVHDKNGKIIQTLWFKDGKQIKKPAKKNSIKKPKKKKVFN